MGAFSVGAAISGGVLLLFAAGFRERQPSLVETVGEEWVASRTPVRPVELPAVGTVGPKAEVVRS